MRTPDSGRVGGELDRSAPADLLDYIADIADELRDLSQRVDSPTLTGLLDLAQKEAALQSRTILAARLNRRRPL